VAQAPPARILEGCPEMQGTFRRRATARGTTHDTLRIVRGARRCVLSSSIFQTPRPGDRVVVVGLELCGEGTLRRSGWRPQAPFKRGRVRRHPRRRVHVQHVAIASHAGGMEPCCSRSRDIRSISLLRSLQAPCLGVHGGTTICLFSPAASTFRKFSATRVRCLRIWR